MRTIKLGNIAIDCRNANALSTFYEKLSGWQKTVLYGSLALKSDEGLVFLFLQADDFEYVAPVWPEEPDLPQKQMHFDFVVDDVTQAVEYATSLGAKKADEQYGEDMFVVMFDPEGHPFCLCVAD